MLDARHEGRCNLLICLTALLVLATCNAAVACTITVIVWGDYVAKSEDHNDYLLVTFIVTGTEEGTIFLESSEDGGKVRFRDENYNIVTQLSVADRNKNFWVEGITTSSAVADVTVTATLQVGGQTQDTDSDTVTVVNVDLQIFRADSDPTAGDNYGAEVDETEEETIGSFTVANLNDTDGDGTQDSGDTNVVAGANGENEHDLMRIIVERPDPNLGGSVTLSVVSGNVAFWQAHTKNNSPVPNLTVTTASITTDHDSDGNPDLEWWVEAREASTSLRNISLKLSYTPPSSTGTLEDVVKATAVWATVTNVVTQTNTPAEVDTLLGNDWVSNGGDPRLNISAAGTNGTGVQPPGTPTQNVIVLEFRVTPNDITLVPQARRPLFDITRQKYRAAYRWASTNAGPTWASGDHHTHYPTKNEQANDDSHSDDETDEPSAQRRMWSMDAPGGGGGSLVAYRGNFREFLRVRFDITDPSGNTKSGSRCSLKQEWSTRTTHGEATSPNTLATGNFAFANEVLSTGVLFTSTTPGTRHHAHNKGLRVAAVAGDGAENVTVRLVDDNVISDTLLHTPTGPVFGKEVPTQVGDQVAYTLVGYYASAVRGWIHGPAGSAGEWDVELAHEFTAGGDNSATVDVHGTTFTQPAPAVPAWVLGSIMTVTITGARADANSGAGGNQNVTLRIVEADYTGDDLLHSLSVSVPRLMTDEGGGNVAAINNAAMNAFNTTGRIAAKGDGEVIGPDGNGGDKPAAQIAYEVDSSWNSTETAVTAPSYSMVAPVIGTNPIPIGGSSTVTMNNIHIEATGTTGNEVFNVRVVDQDNLWDVTLHNVTGVTIPRPAGCFPGALIGPTTANGTLTNPAPGGEVKGPDGESDEKTPAIGYEIGPSWDNSPTVDVTAN